MFSLSLSPFLCSLAPFSVIPVNVDEKKIVGSLLDVFTCARFLFLLFRSRVWALHGPPLRVRAWIFAKRDAKTQTHTRTHTHTHISTVLKISLFLTNQRMVSYSSVHALCKYVEWEGKKNFVWIYNKGENCTDLFWSPRKKNTFHDNLVVELCWAMFNNTVVSLCPWREFSMGLSGD